MANGEYIPVAAHDVESGPQPQLGEPCELTESEMMLLKKSTRWVACLIILQLILATAPLFFGGFSLIPMMISILFISMGIVGLAKQRVGLLTAHFVYSMILYVLSLTVVVLMVLYCERGCDWWTYLFGFMLILFQAIGIRNCRVVLILLKKRQGFLNCALTKRFSLAHQEKCRKKIECELNFIQQELRNNQERETPTEVSTQNIPMMYTIPPQQFVTMTTQPNIPFPHYFPMPVQYPPYMMPPPAVAPAAPVS